MKVTLGEHAGFCFGVKLAVDTIEKNKVSKKLATFGPIIHNDEVIKKFQAEGIHVINDLECIVDETIVIRSHGVPPSIYDTMDKKNIKSIDCTCPFVRKIQNIAKQNKVKGNGIIIVGSAVHPEVIGIKGFAGEDAIIIENLEDVVIDKFSVNKKYAIMVQTTAIKEKFESIVKKIKELGIKLEVNDTICSATTDRQTEAEIMSKNMDCMIIIGDKKSSNTNKLYEISKKNCKKSYLIQTIQDLELNNFASSDRIGIIAGASTPPDIIKEAFNIMSELHYEEDGKTFEQLLNESFVSLHTGDIVTGKVISVVNGEISVNLGYKSDGIITRSEFSEDTNVNPEDLFKEDDDIQVFVIRVNDGDGNVLLSKKRVDSQLKMDELESYFNDKTPISGKIVDTVKGGLIALINEVRVFVPSSQISNKFIDNVNQFKGKTFDFNIIEFDKSKRRIVAGRKALALQEQNIIKEKILLTLEVGQKVEGVVSRIVEFGAFVDLGGVDGLIHISELSWGRIKKVKDVLKEGDKVTVTIMSLDKEKGKISLSMKDANGNPWADVLTKLPINSIVEGKIVRMVQFGVFVELLPGVDGLIHISQISSKHITKPEDELKIGETVKVKVMEIDEKTKRISLSKKEVDEPSKETEEDATE
jgi:small subunit ribosomal protein S1